MKIVVGHLYPDYLNIYADRGNIAVLARRAAWRGYEVEVRSVSIGEQIRPGDHDLLYVGGGQDREQALVAEDLAAKASGVLDAFAGGAAVLAVCGGYQLLGRSYRDLHGIDLPGIGLFPLETVASPPRTLAGFENHAGRTLLDAGAEPLGRVLAGFGNDGESGFEGCRVGRAVGTYLHGPLLPRNPWFADWVIRQALAHRLGGDAPELEPLAAEVWGGDHRGEIHRRVAGPPAAEEALDRRVEHDAVEIVDGKQPMSPHGGIL